MLAIAPSSQVRDVADGVPAARALHIVSVMKNKTEQKPTTTEQIDTIEAVALDNVTGGCAACGMANCTMGANQAAAAPQPSAFNRR